MQGYALRGQSWCDRNKACLQPCRACQVSRNKPKRSAAKTRASSKHEKALDSPPRQILADRTGREEPHRVAAAKQAQNPKQGSPPVFRRADSGIAILYGTHAVQEALRGKRRKLLDLYATEAAAQRLEGDIASAGLSPRIVTAADLARHLGAGAVHQGIMLEALPLEALDLSDIVPQSGIVLVLDQITDPHNVGAILRTAAAFGADALVMTERHAPDMAGAAAKAASGGLEHVAIVRVVNLARALGQLGAMGYLRLGLDSEAETSLAGMDVRRPLALVLGGEGKGLRRLSRESCDALVRLDMPGAIKSLNVSNACAVALTILQGRLTR